MDDQQHAGPVPATGAQDEPAGLAAACDRLQDELEAALGEQEDEDAASSLENAISSLRDVEQRNVSAVQLVALG
jgi:hypothetical protein